MPDTFLSVPTDYRDQTREHQQLVDMHFLAENGKESLVTRFADIRVVGTSGDEHAPFELIADGQVVSGTRCEDCVFLYIRAAATWRPYADIVLQFQHTGGSGCSGQFQFVLVLPDRVGRGRFPLELLWSSDHRQADF